MSMRDAAPLLSLLGHELRAPAGVVGGYLALLEQGRDALTADQHKAVAGARRAQQAMVEALDELRRLTLAWRAEAEPLSWVALPQLVHEVQTIAAARGVALSVAGAVSVAVPRRGKDTALAEALVAVAEAVAREHGADATVQIRIDDTLLVWQVRPVGVDPDAVTATHEFDQWRPGLGMRLVAAVAAITASRGALTDLSAGGARHGVDVRFDLHDGA